MKRNYLYYLLTILLLAVSCEKDEMACTTAVETQEVSSIAATTAQCGGIISSDGNPTIKEAGVEWCTTSDFESNVSCSLAEKAKLGKFACEIIDLKDNTQYYVRAYARNSYGTIYGEVLSFKTLEIVLPAVLTDSVTNITISSATVGGEVTDESNGVVAERGVVYSTNPNPTVENNKVVCGSGKGTFSCNLTDLQDGVTYYVRAYAVNEKGIAYGEEKSFATVEIVVPTVTTASAVNISITSATVGGEVTNDGNGEVAERGVVYSTNPNPTVENNKVVCGRGRGVFTCNLTDLQDGVTYYVRAYAVNEKGTAYGEEKSFATVEIVVPTVTTSSATNISFTSATVGGEILDDGGATVTERGVVYSTTSNPTTSNSKVVSGSGKGSFTCSLNDLQEGTTYYVRAYAVNEKGTAYGEERSFTTKAIVVPTVTTSSATSISYTSATVGGTVTDDGGATVTERGVVYSTTPNPTTSNSKVVSGSGVGSFTCNLSNLQDGVTYYVRAYAANEKGIAYGEEKSFTTKAITIPTVTTSSATSISYTSATVGGTVTDDGGATVTERGVVYSTTPNPTTSNSKVVSGSRKGLLFTCSLNDLQESTTYYVRAYAVNEKGTAYGEEKSFTTTAITVPTVITSSVNNISYTSATIDGTVTDDGGATVTERGVVYSSTPNPTTSNSKVVGGSGKGSFTCNLSNLQDGVTYYVRAYAVNQKGTAYGEEKSFTTKAITVPTVITSSVNNISYTSATIDGTVTDDGGASVTERGVVYSTTPNPTTANSKVSSGSGKGAFTCNLNDLQVGTAYYVRAYAVNEKGTAYGEEQSFKTKKYAFSVSSSKQVVFSSGNLQYTQSTNTWSFAENQWDYIGTDNVTGDNDLPSDKYGDYKYGTALADKIDLFGWSTRANNFGVSIPTSNSDYSGSFVDWGANKIGNDAPNTWRTLTKDEWEYLLNTRTNATSLKGVAQVNGVNGLIFLPDNWTCPAGVTFKSGFHSSDGVDYYAAYQTFTADQWSKLEESGAVFLPAAGYRYMTNVKSVRYYSQYWSATKFSSYNAYSLYFSSTGPYMDDDDRDYNGHSVRLVKDLQ